MACWEWKHKRSLQHRIATKDAAPASVGAYGNQYRYDRVRPNVASSIVGTGLTWAEVDDLFAKAMLSHHDAASTFEFEDNQGHSWSGKIEQVEHDDIDGTGRFSVTVQLQNLVEVP